MNVKDMEVHFIRHYFLVWLRLNTPSGVKREGFVCAHEVLIYQSVVSAGFCDIFILFLTKRKSKKWNLTSNFK